MFPVNYPLGVADATLTCAFLIFLGVLAFAVAAAAFVSFPIFDLDYYKAGLLCADQLLQGTLNKQALIKACPKLQWGQIGLCLKQLAK